MVTTIDPITADPGGSDEQEFDTQADLAWTQLKARIAQMNAQAEDIAALAADVEANAESVSVAKWVSGSYTEGDIAWSPTDYLNYRCKTTGSRTTDPALDPTNWQLLTKTAPGGSDTTSSAVDITLTSTSGRLQVVAMTASGKKATLPSASTLNKGAPVFVFYNSGQYRFAVHKYGGAFLCYVNPGQLVALHCSDISSAAGVWQLSGEAVEQVYSGNSAEVLNAVDSRSISVAMLTSTKAMCCFRNASTTYLNAVVVNYGSSSGSVAVVNAEATVDVAVAAQANNQATVIYKTSTGVTKGYVLDISGNNITPGSVATIDSGTGGSGTAITALSSTQLLCVYQGASPGTPKERILDISGSAITPSSEVAADGTNCAATHLRVGKISATKALVCFRNATGNKIRARLQSVSVSTPSATGSALEFSAMPGTSPSLQFGVIILSTTRALVVTGIDRTYSDVMILLVDISSTTPVLLRTKTIRVNGSGSLDIAATKIDANTGFVAWAGGGSLGVDSIIVKASSDDNIFVSAVCDKLESSIEASNGYLDVAALDSTHVVQLCRNSSTYLSAKVIELAV